MKRIFDLEYSDFMNYSKKEILDSIRYSEGRTVMAEIVISTMSLLDGVSNAETASAFGADMITLNGFDFNYPFIFGYDDLKIDRGENLIDYAKGIEKQVLENTQNKNYLHEFKARIGRFIGVNMEPVPEHIPYPAGRRLSKETILRAKDLGFDYIVVTANPQTHIGNEEIIEGIKLIRELLKDDVLIIAGKMHGAGAGNIYSESVIKDFIKAGADAILVPATGTVPGVDFNLMKSFVDTIHENDALAMSTMGTSQEGSEISTIESFALDAKKAGVDIHHIGDAGYSGMAPPENITALSIAIRGKRHAYRQMARSSRR